MLKDHLFLEIISKDIEKARFYLEKAANLGSVRG